MPDPNNPSPGTDPTPGAFDPAKFREELFGEFNKTLNGFAKSLKSDIQKALDAAKPVDPPPPADPPVDPKPPASGNLPPEVNAQLANLQKTVESLKTANERLAQEREAERKNALEADRVSQIRTVLADIKFKDDVSRNAAFKMFQGDVKRDEDGNLIADSASGPLPFKDYINSQVESLPGLLAPLGAGGSGAASGRVPGHKATDIDSIGPNMTPEQRDQAWKDLAPALTEAIAGR